MIDDTGSHSVTAGLTADGTADRVDPLCTRDVVSLSGRLADLADPGEDAGRIEQIGALEALRSAVAAAQMVVTASLVAAQRAAQVAKGVSAGEVGRGVTAQVALARRESPARASRFVGLGQVLLGELPCTFAALQAGQVSEWRAQIVAKETIWLSAEHRLTLDAEIAGQLAGWGDRRAEAEVRKICYRLDPHGFLDRSRRAVADRRVSLRPAPEAMSILTGLLPMTQGVAVYAALSKHADTLRSTGDQRGRGQIMADTLVERVTGQSSAGAVPLEVHLVMTDHTLLGAAATGLGADPGGSPVAGAGRGRPEAGLDPAQEPAHIPGYGPIPAGLARDLVAGATEQAQAWVRRLYTAPGTSELVAMDSHRRVFTDGLRRFLVIRDQTCRTPWCGAPIRHLDHVIPAASRGPTRAANAQGLCQACNHTKQAPGWTAVPHPDNSVTTTTPTGATYTSQPPEPPSDPRTPLDPSWVCRRLEVLLAG